MADGQNPAPAVPLLVWCAGAFAWGFGKAKVLVSNPGTPLDLREVTTLATAALGEEIIFRLVVKTILESHLTEPAANMGQAAIFAAAHSVNHLSDDMILFRVIDLFASGWAYGRIYNEYGFIAASAAHFLHNLGAELGALSSSGVTA